MRTLLLSTSFAALALPALAAGPTVVVDDPVIVPPAPVIPVTGDWTGPYAGVQLGFGNTDISGAISDEGNGFIGGLTAGYDYDFGSFVLGAGVDYDFSEIELDSGAGQIDSVARLKLRGGYDAGQTLIYATGGAAFADATIGGTSFNDTGYFVGGGIEFMATERFSVGGEVLYHAFDDFDGTGADVDATTFQLRALYRF